MDWYPRPPYPNDLIAGCLFSVFGGLTLSDSTGSGTDEPRSVSWQLEPGTVYEIMFGPFLFKGEKGGEIIQFQFNVTDGADYNFTLGSNYRCARFNYFIPMYSRVFGVSFSEVTSLTTTFAIKRIRGTGFVQLDYADNMDPTVFGVRAIGQLDTTFTDSNGVPQPIGVQLVGAE